MDLSTANIPPGLTIIPTMLATNGTSAATNNGSSDHGMSAPPPLTTTTSNSSESRYPNRRVLRPRMEPKSYAEIESPDINLNGDKSEKPTNGDIDSDDEDAIMPEIEIKELSAAEIWERERKLRKIREELRNEETKLVLLKKIKHSQQVMKENKTPNPVGNASSMYNPLTMLPQSLSKGSLTVTPTNLDFKGGASISRQSSMHDQAQCFPLPRQSLPGGATLTTGTSGRSSFNQGKNVMEGRSSSNLSITPSVTITPTSGPVMNLKTKNQSSVNLNNSVSITPTVSISQNNSMSRESSRMEDNQTQAQKQAAAKLALRKQLEKTLLQIPPPKPPAPEMHFIPNPSNAEFVYLLGLEHVVDYLTKDKKTTPTPQQPFRCAQCKIDFTPVWKMEKDKRSGAEATPRIICESCVTTNVKKALKAEHTNRLKTAFVKALQQEQEIEQRMASQSSSSGAADFSMQSPASQSSSSVTIQPQHQSSVPIALSPAPSKTPRMESSTPRPAPTPPNQPTPPPQSSSRGSSSRHHSSNAAAAAAAAAASDPMSSMTFAAQLNALASLGNFGNLGNLGSLGGNFGGNSSQTAAAMQALQQQMFRGLQGMQGMSSSNQQQQQNLAAQMQFGSVLYTYQLAMAQAQAQAAQQQQASNKGKGKGNNNRHQSSSSNQQQQNSSSYGSNKSSSSNNAAMDMQRALEMQRQYLEMMSQASQMPNQRGGHSSHNNWKNN